MTVIHGVELGDAHADITSHDAYVHGVPHATFQRLRDEDPVSWWDEHDGGRGFWAVTRYDDLLRVSREVETFSSSRGIRMEDMDDEELAARHTMMETDPPDHTRLRRLVQKPFSRRAVIAYEEAIRVLTRRVLDDALPKGRFCFVEEVARKLPMRMLGQLLDLPEPDHDWLVSKGDALIGNSDERFTEAVVDKVDTSAYRLMPFRSPHALDLFDYGERLAIARRAAPGDDIVTALLAPTIDGEPLTEHEFKNFFTLLVAAGNDTTRYSMAGGLLALLQHPDQLALLRDHPELMESAVEEMLRWTTVTMHFRRTAMHDTELNGRAITAGDKVVIWFIAANYDERQFPDPFRFDIRRSPNDHVVFGRQSPHLCLGASLARMELQIVFSELLPRLADIRLDGAIERLRSNFISGITHLPVSVTLA
jgi:cytochrome P450